MPALPEQTAALWRATSTWMAPHAKFFAVYDRPFWRDAGYSGSAQSLVGPMLEIHDATTASGKAALFGFLGVGAVERSRMTQEDLTAACLAQLERLFGTEASRPRATIYKDWAADPLTATEQDPVSSGHAHTVNNCVNNWLPHEWREQVVLASSETSAHEAGYLAGAIEASTTAVATVRSRMAQKRTARL